MTLAELQKKYSGSIKDWTSVSNDDLYEYLDSNREGLQALLESGTLKEQIWAKEVVRRCEQDLMWLAGWFLHENNPETSGNPISSNLIRPENHAPFLDFFVKKDKTKPIAEQHTIKNRLILYPRGSMKALDVDTPIPTPNGFKRMFDLQVGDLVFSKNGSVTRINAVSPVYEGRPCYEVIFSSGEHIVCDEGHLWETDTRKDRENDSNRANRARPHPSVKTTKQISDTVFCRKEHNHKIAVSNPICLPEADLPITPYALGAWLGDGNTNQSAITIDLADRQIADEIQKFGQPIHLSNAKKGNLWHLNGGRGSWDYRTENSFLNRLRKLGVLGNKHIPIIYLRSSYEQRLQLLQGLMDTDGTITPEGRVNFNNTDIDLICDVLELIASLGFKPSVSSTPVKVNGVVVGTSYFINFQPYNDTPVFRLERKLNRLPARKKVSLQNYRHIVAVNKVESRPVKCISVEDESHLYLVGKTFIPTHNSTWGIADITQWILNFPEIRILILTAADDLAVSILDETKGNFLVRVGNPTLMNLFFPEFCKEEKDMGSEYTFTCPVWERKQIRRREPTIMASSVTSTLSGFHFEVLHCDDPVSNRNSENEDQCLKVNKSFKINKKMLRPFGYCTKIGTRYHDCLVAGTAITMADWSQRPIEDIVEGDILVGWKFVKGKGKNHRRMLVPSKVLAVGKHESRPVFKYTFASGRSVVATETHKWWGGKGSVTRDGKEGYNILAFKYGKLTSVRRLLVPKELNPSRSAAWLAGIYDGEGSFDGNPGYPSGQITIAQTKHNPGVVDRIRKVLTELDFEFSEYWYEPGKKKNQEHWKDKCEFKLLGGWKERYRFLIEIAPTRIRRISESLFGQLYTEEDRLVSIEPVGDASVYFFQTETGNYIADGCCSKNSDMYGIDLENNIGEYETTEGSGWELTRNTTTSSLILIGKAIQVKPKVREELSARNIPVYLHYQEAEEDGCILVMPNVLSYSYLLGEYNRDRSGERQAEEGTFEGQMNQNPTPEENAVFDMPLLLRRTLPFTELPFRGLISQTWDFAFSKKERRDFSTGSSIIWNDRGQAFVNDLVRDRFPTPTSLAKAVVDLAKKHHPFVVGIEDAGASRFLEPTIVTEAYKTGDPFVIQVCSKIDWIPVDHQKEAKKARMAALQPLLADNLLFFASHLPYLKTLYEEFMRCQVNLRRHNDIPDVISFQPRYAPRIVKQIVEQGISTWSRDQAMYNLIFEENTDPFGLPGGGGVMTATLEEPKVSEDFYQHGTYAPGLDNILGGGLIG